MERKVVAYFKMLSYNPANGTKKNPQVFEKPRIERGTSRTVTVSKSLILYRDSLTTLPAMASVDSISLSALFNIQSLSYSKREAKR
jgi:hypothetical protein